MARPSAAKPRSSSPDTAIRQGSQMTVDIRAGSVTDFAEGQRVMIDVNGREVFVFEREGRFFAY